MKKALVIIFAVCLTFAACGLLIYKGLEINQMTDSFTEIEESSHVVLKVFAPDKTFELVKRQCDDFITKYPDKDITINVFKQSEDVPIQIDTNIDIVTVYSDQIHDLATSGDLLEVFKEPVEGLSSEIIIADNCKNSIKAATVDDKLFAYPTARANSYVLYYDKRDLSEDDVKTWEGILKACKAKNKHFRIDVDNGYYACMFAFTGGACVDGFEDDGITQNFVDYDENKVVDTLFAFTTLFHDYEDVLKTSGSSGSAFSFATEKTSAMIDGTWNAQEIQEILGENMGISVLPAITINGQEITTVGLMSYTYCVVNSTTTFPAVAQLLAAYLSSEECQMQCVKELSECPTNKKVAVSEYSLSQPLVKTLVTQSETFVSTAVIQDSFWHGFSSMGDKLFYSIDNNHDKDTITKLWRDTVLMVKNEN